MSMNLLALDTSTEACSAALMCDGRIIERSEMAPRRHAELILPMIDSLMAEAGIGRRDIDGVAVGRGPGAFTGVRLGISIAQGLALGLDVPVLAVSSLAALAQGCPQNPAAGNTIVAMIDARMGEIYAGAYLRGADGVAVAIGVESVGSAVALNLPAEIFEHGRFSVVGTGWDAYRETLVAKFGLPTFTDGARYPQARDVLQLAIAKFRDGHAQAPELALPVYLRDKVALTLNEQRAR